MALSSPISETAAKRALNIAQDAPTDDDTSPIAKRPLFAAGAAAPKQLFDDISSSDGGEDSDEGDDLFEANPSSNDRPIASEGASSIALAQARTHRSGCRFEYDYTAIESPQKRQRRGRSFPPPSPALHLSQSSSSGSKLNDAALRLNERRHRSVDFIVLVACGDGIDSQPPISENDASFRSFESKFAAQVHHKFTETQVPPS